MSRSATPRLLLDASALMALLRREPGWEVVQAALHEEDCLICMVQLVEVEGKLVSRGNSPAARFSRNSGHWLRCWKSCPLK